MKPRLSLICAAAAILLLAGCDSTRRIVLCPGTAVLADTATVTQFRAGAPQDLSGEAITATITGSTTECTLDRSQSATYSTLTIGFRATRPPSADRGVFTLPYFVAVNQGERVISKEVFRVRFEFAPGQTVATAEEYIQRTVVNLETGHLPPDYQLLAGFQISEEQRAYNLKMGRYRP